MEAGNVKANLSKRFKKGPAFFEDYKQFMSNLLVQGYAEMIDDSPVGRTWYIPHQGVHHPSKQSSVRLQCSVRWKVTESIAVNRS